MVNTDTMNISAVVRTNYFGIKKYDLDDIIKSGHICVPYALENHIDCKNGQKNLFKTLKKGDTIMIRQTNYGSNKNNIKMSLIVKIDSNILSGNVPKTSIVLKSEVQQFNIRDLSNDEFRNFIIDIGVLSNEKVLDYHEKDYLIKPFFAEYCKVKVIQKHDLRDNKDFELRYSVKPINKRITI